MNDREGVGEDALRLGRALRSRLGEPPRLGYPPLVSIVVVNRNGADQLRVLLDGLIRHTDHTSLELILVDNGSTDRSLDALDAIAPTFPTHVIRNRRNESFADACNQGAACAGGELILFLNNDVEPFEGGWLSELVACLGRPGVALAGATLLQREGPSRFVVQQRGALIRDDEGVLRAGYRDHGADPFDDRLGRDLETVAVSGACALVRRRLFEDLGGFTHGFVYGAEDSDFALKVRARGGRVVCSGRSLAIHAAGTTLSTVDRTTRAGWTAANRRLLWERWGPRIRREYTLDCLAGAGIWSEPRPDRNGDGSAVARALAVGFCLRKLEPPSPRRDDLLDAVRRELESRGHPCEVLLGDEVDSAASLDHDVVVDFGPAGAVNPARFNVLWTDTASAAPTTAAHALTFTADPDRQSTATIAERLVTETLARIRETAFPTRIPSEHGTGGQEHMRT